MQCPSCGQVGAPNARFCGNCGAALTAPQQPQMPYLQAPPRKKTSPWVWVGTGAGVLLLLVIVLAVALSGPDPAPAQTGAATPAQKTAPAPAQKSSSLANSYFVGKWRCFSFGGGFCPVGWEDLQIRADGAYTLAGKSNGTWKMDGQKAVFDGPLAFAGPAEKYQNDQFQFNYVDSKSGFGTYIIFVPY